MTILFSILAYTGPGITREYIMEYLSTWPGSAWSDCFRLFGISLVLSAVWLVWGRWQSWASNHRVLPLGLWALQASQLSLSEFETPLFHGVFIAGQMISSALALFVISLMIALSGWRTSRNEPVGGMTLGFALVPIATVFLDGFFGLLIFQVATLPAS